MSFETDILASAVRTLRADLPEDRRVKFDEWAAGRSLEEQKEALVSAAMKGWREPDFLKAPVQPEVFPYPGRQGRPTAMTDLFGRELTERDLDPPKRKPRITRILGPLHYRPSTDKAVRCATCAHHMLHCPGSRRYHKCDLVGCTFGPGTDIRARWVCDAWKKSEEEQG